MIVFAVFVAAFVLLGAGLCFCLDTGYRPPVRRMVSGLIAAMALAAVVYAAELPVKTCNDFEKYSFFWYFNLCFLYEGSS